ncbi:hypothetical protein H2198_006831 [Neophaeococcomyces mojaviensis]|uniref:Uncharacterized protein n=1 Tax=Neophaeococcomyces mojaviensis TaxID=3383035 RepID=A0ACC3A2B9_9EURO|nr:hypothetical protein H2198_006831 [Knufia sp. JES_112]
MTKVVGLIGGFSWRTTALYYREINQHVSSKLGGIHSANILIRSLDYAEVANFITTEDFTGMTDLFCKSGHELKSAGASALVLCANVAHKAADALKREVGLPILHIADFAGREVMTQGYKKVGLLATRAVMEEDFYLERLRSKYGLEVFVPDKEFREKADRLIFEELSKEVVEQDVSDTIHGAYQSLVREEGVECIILGCTEFRLVFGEKDKIVPTFETTSLHARGIAEWLLEEA